MIKNLKRQLSLALPGRPAQYRMAFSARANYPPPPPDARVACTLALLYPKDDAWHIVLIERMSSDNPEDRHSGQISFPGGGLEPTDATSAAGAIRETHEEIGVDPDTIELLGELTDIYIPVSNFLVHPFVGTLDYTPDFTPQPTEVRSILEVPLSVLMDPATIQKTDMKIANQITIRNVPYYSIDNHIVWGATAMMLSELVEVLEKSIKEPKD